MIAGFNNLPRRDIFLLLLIAAGEICRLVVPFIHNPIQNIWSDPGRHWEYASTGTNTPPLALIDPILFQAWLSFVAKFTLDIPELTALYAGMLSAITPWLWYRFLRELLPSKTAALFGWAVFAWLPSWIGIYSYYMTETLLLPLMGLSLWLSWRAMRKKDVSSFVLAAFVWTLAGLTRAPAAPIAAAVTIFVWLKQNNKVASAVLTTLLIGAILGALSYRSYVRAGVIAPLGHGAMNSIYAKSGSMEIITHLRSPSKDIDFVYGFGSPSMNLRIFEPFSEWTSSRQGSHHAYINLDSAAASWTGEQESIAERGPPRWPLVAENMAFLFFGPSWPDTNRNHFFENLSWWTRFAWAPALVAGLFFLGRMIVKGERRHAPPLLLALVVWIYVQGMAMLVVNEGRYRKPGEGLIVAALLLAYSHRRAALAGIAPNPGTGAASTRPIANESAPEKPFNRS